MGMFILPPSVRPDIFSSADLWFSLRTYPFHTTKLSQKHDICTISNAFIAIYGRVKVRSGIGYGKSGVYSGLYYYIFIYILATSQPFQPHMPPKLRIANCCLQLLTGKPCQPCLGVSSPKQGTDSLWRCDWEFVSQLHFVVLFQRVPDFFFTRFVTLRTSVSLPAPHHASSSVPASAPRWPGWLRVGCAILSGSSPERSCTRVWPSMPSAVFCWPRSPPTRCYYFFPLCTAFQTVSWPVATFFTLCPVSTELRFPWASVSPKSSSPFHMLVDPHWEVSTLMGGIYH